MAREKRLERMDERTVSLRFGSVVPRINQLCLSVFHRAGGELISFSLNTNSFFFLFSFFSRQKPISIKMARAFRILPDYKRLPSQLPLPLALLRLSTPSCSNTPRFYPLTALFEFNPLHHPLIHTPATRFDPLFSFISFLPPDFLFPFYFFFFFFFLFFVSRVFLFLFLFLLPFFFSFLV